VPPTASAVSRLAALASALEAVAAATTSANADALAACEARLEAALAHVPAASDLPDQDRSAALGQLRRIQRVLHTCRALGQAATDLISLSLSAQGVAAGYRPAGAPAQALRLGRLEVRV
jgi:hypothetical protein